MHALDRLFLVLFLLFCGSAVLALARVAQASGVTITVNDLGDTLHSPGCATTGTGACTLRDAITFANSNAGTDTINFGTSGTITLTATLPGIGDDMTIDGSGQNITVSGNNSVRVMTVNGGKTLNLNALTIANGIGASCGFLIYCGGGVDNYGTMILANSTLSNNSVSAVIGAARGGGIYNNGTLTVTNSTLYANSTSFEGGGIYNNGALIVINSTLSSNFAQSSAGGIFNNSTATIQNTLIVDSQGGGNCIGSFTASSTNNMADDNTCGSSFDQKTFAEINLGSLVDNGGPTLTMALRFPSAAIDAGDNTTCQNAPVNNLDQRGFARPFPRGGHCDIGSYEFSVMIIFVPFVAR